MILTASIILILILISALFIITIKFNKKLQSNLLINKQLEESRNSAIEYIDALWESQQNLILDEKLSSLSSLVAGVAHELNTPLGVALTSLSYLETECINEECKPMLELANSSLLKSISLVNFFAEISGRDIKGDTKRIDFREFINYTCCLVKSPLAVKHIRNIELNIEEDLQINSSEASLSIIFRNILENAFDYAYADDKNGAVSITTKVKKRDLIVTIKDNGCGMSDKDIQHIFEPFYTTRRPEKHYGLGLAIAYNLLARQHNGTLICNSVVDQGTEIVITLPNVMSHTPQFA